MKSIISVFLTAVLAAGAACAQPTPPPEPNQEQPEVLTKGPVHEAFAEPIEIKSEPGVVAPNEPPPNIAETPPDEKPAGKQYVWIPGYWAWDSEQNSYIWVSGCWRAAPPERYWVPGYWSQTQGGWEWVPGFWASSSDQQQIQYLPAPPVVTDIEAPGPPPTPDELWVPPCWYWYQDNYILRQGYWLQPYEDWIWTPSHYIWTPRGYVFVSGYWDCAFRRRGVLFAPVYIPRPLYLRPGFSLSLDIVLDVGALELNLFTYPRYCHYYFGDYYNDIYIGFGIYPAFEWRTYHTWYDALYVHSRWRHHETPEAWLDHRRHEYDLRRKDPALRPPATYREMQRRLAVTPEAQRANFRMAEPIRTLAANKSQPMKFEQIKAGSMEKYVAGAWNVHQFSQQRRTWESQHTEQQPIQRPAEHKAGTTRLNERGGPIEAPTEHIQSEQQRGHPEVAARQPAEAPREQGTYEQRGGFARGNRETRIRQPEQAHIPLPPIVGQSNTKGFFGGTITPSHPAGEHRMGGGQSGSEGRGSGGGRASARRR
jgi:hypothetical protein